MSEPVTILRYGAGVNSTAMLLLWLTEGRRLDYVCFSDTGGERPVTLEWVERVRAWLAQNYPQVQFVVVKDANKTLEQHSLATKRLPSLAYGFRSCSVRFKVEPYLRWVVATIPPPTSIVELIGFDAGEANRVNRGEQTAPRHKGHAARARQLYPLFAQRLTRADCERIILTTFGCLPPKSACFFCPASSAHEVAALAVDEPELFARAVAIEQTAEAPPGANYAVSLWGKRSRGKTWAAVGRAAQEQAAPQLPAIEGLSVPCGCADGYDEEDED